MKKFLSVFFIFSATQILAIENYSNYYVWVNEAEEAFINHDNKKCFQLYDQAFERYGEPFVKDNYVAAEIAYSTGDTERFIRYLGIAFKNGMPLSALGAAPILKDVQNNLPLYHKIGEQFLLRSKDFKTNIDEIDSLQLRSFADDSLKVAFGKSKNKDTTVAIKFVAGEEAFRQYVYGKYISKGVFPSEKITGIETDTAYVLFRQKYNKVDLYPKDEMAKMFANGGMKLSGGTVSIAAEADKTEYSLSNTLAFNIFIHSTCTIDKYGRDLWTCVLNGYLHPKDYGMLEEMCLCWNREGSPFFKYAPICNYEKKDAYYNILKPNPFRAVNVFVTDRQLLKKVEENRKEHFMQKYSVDVQKKELEKDKGFKFFFGFNDLR